MLSIGTFKTLLCQTTRKHAVAFPLLLAFLFALFFFGAQTCPAQTLKVGYFEATGFNDLGIHGAYSGYGYDYLMEIAKYTGWKYEFITMSPTKLDSRLSRTEALALLKDGKVDIVGGVSKDAISDKSLTFPFFSSGTNYGVLSANKGDSRFNSENIDSLEHVSIGYYSKDAYVKELRDYFAKKKNTRINFVKYESIGNLNYALKNYAVDLIYSNMLRSNTEQTPLIRLNAHPFYFVTAKNSPYSSQLDGALNQIVTSHPEFGEVLQKEHFPNVSKASLALSPLELSYLSKNDVVTVAINKNNYPFEYYDEKNKTVKGVVGDVLSELQHTSGLSFTYIPCNSYSEEIALVKSGKAQIISSFADDYQWADSHGVRVTNPYINLQMSMIVNDRVSDALDKNNHVGVLSDNYITAKLEKNKDYKYITSYSEPGSLINDVNNGKIDVGFLPTYAANYYLGKSYYPRIKVRSSAHYNYGGGLGVSKKSDALLYVILNKGLDKIPDEKLAYFLNKNLLNSDDKPSLTLYFLKYPYLFIGLLALLFAGIIIINFGVQRSRERRRREHFFNEEKLHLALAQTKIHVWDYDVRSNMIKFSDYETESFFQLTKKAYSPEELIEVKHIHPESAGAFKQLIADVKNGSSSTSALIKVRRRLKGDKTYYKWTRMTLTLVYDDSGQVISAVGVSEDAAQEVALQEKASRDVLTKLLNRESLKLEVEDYLKSRSDNGTSMLSAIFMIDIDDFKHVNDAFGHKRGDEILIHAADSLTRSFRSEDIVARLGGDEFIVFMKNAESAEVTTSRAELLMENLTLTYHDIAVTCSIGIYLVPQDTISFDDLYEEADVAMYEAKSRGKSQFVLRENTHANFDYKQ